MNHHELLRHGQVMDLIAETFHRGRRDNAVVEDSLCSHPEILGGENWFGFRCRQRRPDGLYRRIQSTRVRGYYPGGGTSYGWAPRTTFIGAWVDESGAAQEGLAA